MSDASILRGVATISFYADDMAAAKAWYSELLGMEPYFANPKERTPAYLEFRLGDYQHELGLIDRKYAPKGGATTPGGAIAYWHVTDLEAAVGKVKAMGATEFEPITPRGNSGFVTASVIDPFGNVLGLMYNPHYVEILKLKQG